MLPSSQFVKKQPSESAVATCTHVADKPLLVSSRTLLSKVSLVKGKHCHIPLTASTLPRYENVRLGLRGGSPMWPAGGGNNREPWTSDQKQPAGREPEVGRRHGPKGRGSNGSDKNVSDTFVPGSSSLEDLATARAKVASLVAADYNDFDDENSQLTPPDPKTGGRNPSLDVEISSELELLAESENIVIVDHMSDDNIVAGSDVIEECIISTSNIDLVDVKEKIEQVVEEDEQHVVMMIEENTLTASFSVEQRDKLMSKTIVRKLKPVEDSDAVSMLTVGENDSSLHSNEGAMVKSSSDSDVLGESQSVDVSPLDPVAQTPSLSVVVDADTSITANSPSIIDSQGAMNLVQKHTNKEVTDTATNNGVKTDAIAVADSFENNSVLEDLEMNIENENSVLDLSTTVQDCTKVEAEGESVARKLEEGNTSRQVVSSQQPPAIQLPVNKALKGVGQMLLVADSPESPDQQEMNVDPSPEPLYHEFDSMFNKLGQGTENLTLPSAKHREIFTTHLPKDTSVSVRAKESISALLKEEPKKYVESNASVVSLSGSRGVSCVPVRPAAACPTKSKPSTNIDSFVAKPTLSEQQSFIVSRGAVSISLLDPSASSSVASPCVSKSSANKSDTGVSDVVSIQRRKRSEQPTHKEKTVVATETSVVPVYPGDQCLPIASDSGHSSPTTSAMNLGLPRLVCSTLSTVTISVITTTPKSSSQPPSDTPISATYSTSTETQPASSYTIKNTPGARSKAESPLTTQSLQAAISTSVPSSSACTLSVINAGETYVPLTGIASSAQVSQLLNLPARSLQTLIENNQLFKSCSSPSQSRNVPVSSTQSVGEPIFSVHEGTGTKSQHVPLEIQAAPKCSETREDESSQSHTLPIHYQSRNSEGTSHLGGKTKTMPGFDVTSKFLDQSKSTIEQNSPVNVTKTTSQVHPQIVSVLESRLMSSSEYSYQQMPVTTSTGNAGSLQSGNTSIRAIPSQTSYSRQVPNTATNTGGMATSTTSIVTNLIQNISSQSTVSVAKGNTVMASQQSSLIPPLYIKEEKMDDNLTSSLPDILSSSKISPSNRLEESQNVLLKQLLQNTGCAQTQSTISVPSLEAQLAQPVPSTPSALLSPLLLDTAPPAKPEVSPAQRACMPVSRTPSREDVFSPLPSPKREAPPPPTLTSTPQASPRREAPPLLSSPKREAPPPQAPPPQASPKQEPSPGASPSSFMSPKREIPLPQASPNNQMQLGLIEIKKEVMEESERKAELGHIPDQSPSDIKKMKRRQYQQKRRQSQGKEAIGGSSKKRQKKVTTVEEDWDTYMENLMQNLQQLPSIHVQEPSLPSNPIVGIIFGAGDLTKLADGNSSGLGELHGTYGNANLFQVSDYYDSKPFGPCIPLPPPLPISTQRGFYDQEFAPLKFGNDSEDKKSDAPARDFDSPQSVISSSSPECLFSDTPIMFPGLRLINPDSDEEDSRVHMSSPVLPLLAPVPIRLMPIIKEVEDIGKENKGSLEDSQLKLRPLTGIPLRDSGNVAVTLTLSSAAADDIVGVLRDLANFLHIPPPSSYQIVERTITPPSQKLGLYRSKGKDGKEGAPIDIQSILNGEAKFCRHCDVVILNNSIKKKVSDLPFLAKEDIPDNEDFLNFCSTSCYMQFALMHRLPSITQDKAAATVDHLCQSEISVKATKIKEEVKKSDDQNNKSLRSSLFEKGVDIEKPPAEILPEPGTIKVKSVGYKTWSPGALQPAKKMKKTTDREMTEMLFRMGITVMPPKIPEDTRLCIFCHHIGDGIADGPARLLNYDVDRWVHLNCALWSDDVYETVNGALMNLDNALKQSLTTSCVTCHKNGASIRCFKLRCSNVYHLSCAVKSECVFFKNKTMYCTAHIPKNEKDNELTTLAVFRRVYVDRDENRQVASVMHRSDHNHLMRVGSLIFLNVGQLLPHQLQAFHTINCIYPIGYKIVRFYWSMRVHNKRCRYVCTIHDVAGRPEFRVLVQEPNQDDLELRDSSPKAVWARILEPMALMRKEMCGIQVFPRFVSGEDLFGLTEPAIVRILESLPGVESMNDYRFKYGRNPLLELPLAVNPTGSARSEPKLRIAYPWKRPHTQRTATSSRPVFVPTATVAGEAACPYSKQFVHSKSSQYKKMKQDWRNNVYLARSKIQGLGLYAARDLERHTMVIEYIGEVIRTELSELREKLYEARNRGIYMFRLDEERVVDATLSGGLARYINHSCNPNCVAEIVEVDRDLRIIIFAKKRISRGEELAYDYKFDIEDDQHKIPCNCGAANCKKWMN